MTLRLTIISPATVPPGFEQTVTLGSGAISIGRAPENDLVLADPARQLSKFHCKVTAVGAGFVLTDTSSNGVFVNGSPQRVARDQSVPIAPGDVLRIGDYELKVDTMGSAQSETAQPAFGEPDRTEVGGFVPPLPDEDEPAPDDEFDLGFALADDDDDLGVSAENPFADAARLLRETAAGNQSGFDPTGLDLDDAGSGGSGGESLLPHGPEGTLYAKPMGGRSQQPSRQIPADDFDPFGDSDDAGEEWDSPPMPDNIPSEQVQFSPPAAKTSPPAAEGPAPGGAIPDDWDLDEDSAPPAPPDAGASSPFLDPPPAAADNPFTPAAAQPAPPAAQPAAPTQPQHAPPPQPSAPAGGVADSAALRAFLTGAGLGSMRLSDDAAVQMLADVGRAFRAMVGGLQEALATRAEIKEELDVSRTMIGATSNNPLKLDLSLDEGVVAMLRQPGPGFLAPVDAVNQSYRDLQAHQMATMAAMHLALRRLLEKFDPDSLAQRMDQSSLLNSLMPGARKSKYWEAYCSFYDSIAGDAESEFHEFFTKEFSKAYEEQTRKLK